MAANPLLSEPLHDPEHKFKRATRLRNIRLTLVLLFGFVACLTTTTYALGHLPTYMAWHASLMLVAWGLMLPVGVLLARFFKVTPEQDFPKIRDNQFWWNWHRGLQYGGLILASFSTGLMWQKTGLGESTHAQLGLALIGLAWLQAVSSWVRGSKGGPTEKQLRGDHYDMTARRLVFESWHKTFGWTCLVAALLVIGSGFYQVGAPSTLYIGIPAVLALVFTIVFSSLTKQKRWIDTYKAIWGHAYLPKQKRTP